MSQPILSVCVIGLFALGPAAAAAQSEADPEQQFREAQSLMRANDPEAALPLYSRLADQFPGNVDYSFGRAQALARAGREREALLETDRAILLAPGYEAVWRLRFRLMTSRPELVSAADLAKLRSDARVRFPDSSWWREAASEEKRRQLTLVLGVEDLSNDQPNWRNQAVRVDWAQSERTDYFVAVSRDERFDDTDIGLSGGLRRAIGERLYGGLELSLYSAPKFMPDAGFSAFLGAELGDGWVAELRLRQRDYETAKVSTWSGTAERYVRDFRLFYTLHASRLHGLTTSTSHVAGFDWYLSERTSLGITLARGDEADVIAPGQILATDVAGVTLNGRLSLNDSWGFRWWLGSHEQGDFYRRRYAGVAITAGF